MNWKASLKYSLVIVFLSIVIGTIAAYYRQNILFFVSIIIFWIGVAILPIYWLYLGFKYLKKKFTSRKDEVRELINKEAVFQIRYRDEQELIKIVGYDKGFMKWFHYLYGFLSVGVSFSVVYLFWSYSLFFSLIMFCLGCFAGWYFFLGGVRWTMKSLLKGVKYIKISFFEESFLVVYLKRIYIPRGGYTYSLIPLEIKYNQVIGYIYDGKKIVLSMEDGQSIDIYLSSDDFGLVKKFFIKHNIHGKEFRIDTQSKAYKKIELFSKVFGSVTFIILLVLVGAVTYQGYETMSKHSPDDMDYGSRFLKKIEEFPNDFDFDSRFMVSAFLIKDNNSLYHLKYKRGLFSNYYVVELLNLNVSIDVQSFDTAEPYDVNLLGQRYSKLNREMRYSTDRFFHNITYFYEYYSDKNNVYYIREVDEGKLLKDFVVKIKILKGANPANFSFIDYSYYATSEDYIYYNGELIDDADINTFVVENGVRGCAKDKNYRYVKGVKISLDSNLC